MSVKIRNTRTGMPFNSHPINNDEESARTVSGAEFIFSTPNESTAPLNRNGTHTFITLEPTRRLIEIMTLKVKAHPPK